MRYALEKIIDDMKDSLDYTDLGYSGGQSVDRNYCPICGADDVIRYNSNQPQITMNTIEHNSDCLYVLVRKLEKELENEITTEDLSTLKTQIRDDIDGAKYPSANEFNAGLDSAMELTIGRIEILEEKIEEEY